MKQLEPAATLNLEQETVFLKQLEPAATLNLEQETVFLKQLEPATTLNLSNPISKNGSSKKRNFPRSLRASLAHIRSI